MARSTPRPETSSTATLTEITRRYYACAVALAKAMGLPLSEQFIRDHRESISSCFIESGRAGVRLAAGVKLSPLVPAPAKTSVIPLPVGEGQAAQERPAVTTSTTIPAEAGLPCQGQLIVELKPAPLAMLLNKVQALAEAQGGQWVMLLQALQAERARRLAAGTRKGGS